MLRAWLKIVRPKDWIKNLLVLAPLIFAGAFASPDKIAAALLAVLFFTAASAATYMLNDLIDLEHDRAHARKRLSRPLASGELTVQQVRIALAGLYLLLLLAALFRPAVGGVVAGYLVLNALYSLALKRVPVLDILVIAVGFVLRAFAGALAIEVQLSPWMFVTTLSLALFLAASKRRQELRLGGTEQRPVLAHYSQSLAKWLAVAASILAIVFYALYVFSAQPGLMLTIPVVIFGIVRYWWIIEKPDTGDSPTDILYQDPALIITIALWLVLCIYVLLGGPTAFA